MLFELGPCRISACSYSYFVEIISLTIVPADNGNNITEHEYSWNNNANIVFLDQPINVGYSYSDDGSTVDTSPVAGHDVYAFLELFYARFPKYSKLPFHLAAESYGGTYAPNIANIIHQENQALAMASTSKLTHIPLASVVLANGLTNPYVQMGSVADYACDGPFPVYDDPEGPQCAALRTKIPTCQRLIEACYSFESRFTCVPALLYCNSQLFGPLMRESAFSAYLCTLVSHYCE